MKINHIGYMIGEQQAIESFIALGYQQKSAWADDVERGVWICFVEKDTYQVELIVPKDEQSTIYNMYKKLGNTPYHICYEVRDLEQTIIALKEQGYVLVQPRQKAIAFEGKSVAFLYSRKLGMIELLEEVK